MKNGILAMVMTLLKRIGVYFALSFRYSSDSQSSKYCTKKVSLGMLSSQVSTQSASLEDVKWILATVSDQLERVEDKLADLREE